MKEVKMKVLLVVICLGMFQVSVAQKKRVLTPSLNNKKVLLQTGTLKASTYYSLSKKYGTLLKLGGPGEITIFLRTKMDAKETIDNPYHVRYILDGKIVRVTPVQKSKVSKKTAIVGETDKVSVVQKIKITIPPGKHRLEVFSINGQRKVYSKYYFVRYPNPIWKTKLPTDEMEIVSLTTVKSKKNLKYYRIDSKTSMKVDAEGNSYLRLVVRGEFKHSMFSDNEVRILMKENGKIIHTFKISSVRSKHVVYTNGGSLIPGTSNTIYLQIPPGDHQYEFVVADKSKSALIKVSYDKERLPASKQIAKSK